MIVSTNSLQGGLNKDLASQKEYCCWEYKKSVDAEELAFLFSFFVLLFVFCSDSEHGRFRILIVFSVCTLVRLAKSLDYQQALSGLTPSQLWSLGF